MSTYAKNFIALESDPEIFTDLMHSLGVKRSVRIIDIWSLDEDALAFVPRPVLALILVLPPGMRGEDEEGETKSEGKGKVEDERKGGENIVWFKQTIHNACGLYALLHGVCNNPGIIGEPSVLNDLMAQSHPTRQKFLETSKELEELHTLAARKGSTDVPEPDGEVEHHYVCFVVAEGRIWELDGDMEGEIDRGEVKGEGQDGDVLSGGGVDAVRNYLEKKTEGTFSLMAVVEEKE